MNKLPPLSYTIFSLWQLNSYVNLTLWTYYAPLFHHFTPLADQLLPHLNPSETKTPSLLQQFTPLAAQLSIHFTPTEQITPHSHANLSPLAAQLLHHFAPPPEQITPTPTRLAPLDSSTLTSLYLLPSLFYHFNPLGNSALSSFYHLWTNTPIFFHHFTPLGSPNLTSFYPPELITPLTLTTFYHFPAIAAHCSLLQPTLRLQFQIGEGSSSKFLPLPTIAAHS